MRWGNNRKLEFSLKYDERSGMWLAHVQESNKHGFTKKFKTCAEANEWYAEYKDGYCAHHMINDPH